MVLYMIGLGLGDADDITKKGLKVIFSLQEAQAHRFDCFRVLGALERCFTPPSGVLTRLFALICFVCADCSIGRFGISRSIH